MAGLNYGNRYQLVSVKTKPGNHCDFKKPIVVYDLDWNKVDEIPSVKDTAEKFEISEKVVRYRILNKKIINEKYYIGYKPQW